MWEQVITDFVTLWVVVDPIGTLPVFVAFTMHKVQSRTIALRAIMFYTAILLFLLFLVR